MSAHTQGPWRLEFAGHNDLEGDFDIETATVRGAGDLVVAEVEPHHASVADVVANAQLIAAAPELLAFVRRVAEYADYTHDEVDEAHILRELQRAAQPLLAKADGLS